MKDVDLETRSRLLGPYEPSRGGHAPGHLREAFLDLIGGHRTDMVAIGDDEIAVAARWLARVMWNCTDIMPSGSGADLDLPDGSTYAMAARRFLDEVKK
jgi:hypothetical protein